MKKKTFLELPLNHVIMKKNEQFKFYVDLLMAKYLMGMGNYGFKTIGHIPSTYI